jgi:hypothetical protein
VAAAAAAAHGAAGHCLILHDQNPKQWLRYTYD